MSKRDVQYSSTLKTETRVRADWNFNKTVGVMSRPGEVIYYKAPYDPAAHPMYVDAEGRNLPVNPQTLQIMTNANNHVVDINGFTVPRYEGLRGSEGLVHEDDVRVAVAARDIVVTNQDDEDILLAPDGTIIPFGDDGVPNTVMIGGVPWATDRDGNPIAPLERVMSIGTYHKPVEAFNAPRYESLKEQVWDELFPIESIVEADRPRRRGALKAWAEDNTSAISSYTGTGDYKQGRFYAASPDDEYKYWTPDEPAAVDGTLLGAVPGSFSEPGWQGLHTTNVIQSDGQYSADFNWSRGNGYPDIDRSFNIEPGSSYTLDFSVLSQTDTNVNVVVAQRRGNGIGGMRHKTIKIIRVNANEPHHERLTFTTDTDTIAQIIRFQVRRVALVSRPRVSFSGFVLRKTTYQIDQVGPRVSYDRPLPTNKISIGVDYTVDERNAESASNMPVGNAVRAMIDRGDGVCTWQIIARDVMPDDDGFITLYNNGGSWTEDFVWGGPTKLIKAVQFDVTHMNLPGARLNIMSMAQHMTQDWSDRFIEYNTDFEVADSSFVLPFGTVSANVGSMVLANEDGLFNSESPYLLNTERVDQDGRYSYSDTPNPYHKLLNGETYVTIDTCVYDADMPPAEKEWLRMLSMHADSPSADNNMNANFDMKDSAKQLQQRIPQQLFYTDTTGMSAIQVIYMLLDSVGFTSVQFFPHDIHDAVHMNYFWTSENDTVWQVLENICRSAQITAYFDESDVLCFRSLRSVYEDALHQPPKALLTTDDINGMPSNIIDVSEGEMMQTNRVEVGYKELKPGEVSEAGVAKMEEVWSPEGDVVVRAQPLVRSLPAQKVSSKNPHGFWMPIGSTESWHWEGLVNIEGEMIRYKGKQYQYWDAAGNKKYHMIFNDEERKRLDRMNPELSYKNQFSGAVRVLERGAEGSMIRSHDLGSRDKYITRIKVRGKPHQTWTGGITFAQSRMRMKPPPRVNHPHSVYVMAHGSSTSYPPQFFGTRMRIIGGSNSAGIAAALSSTLNGIYVELSTTEHVESTGRQRNELSIFVKQGDKRIYFEPERGTIAPIVKDEWYDLQVSMMDGVRLKAPYEWAEYERTTLRFGSRGNTVKVLQRALNVRWKEKLVVDGVFGKKTENAVKRMQKKQGLSQTGVMNRDSWRAMSYQVDTSAVTVHVWLDGAISNSITIPKKDLPATWDGGLYGLYCRSQTTAEFEYLYAFRGSEDLIDDGDNGLMSKVTGSYFSDQLNNGYFYQRKYRYITRGGKKILRNSINEQFFFDDFGAWVHEVRDWDINFSDLDRPSEYSHLYSSNTMASLIAEYQHKPLGAKFRIANTARYDAILNGDDPLSFGIDNSVQQHMMVYGRVLQEDSDRHVTIEDKNSTRSIGVHDLSIDVPWIQSNEAANKLGAHIVEAMALPVRTYSVDVFGNPYLKIGDMVVLNAPEQGASSELDLQDINKANRYIITNLSHQNNGSHSTTAEIRQLIGRDGFRYTRLSDILEHNNNNMLLNQYLDEYEFKWVNNWGTLTPKHVDALSSATIKYRAEGNGRGFMEVAGSQSTPPASLRHVGFQPQNILLTSGDRPAHNIGDYYMWTVDVTAISDCAVTLVIDGFNTSGFAMNLASRRMRLKRGQHKRVVLTGQFLEHGTVRELMPRLQLASYDGDPGTTKEKIMVHDMFYRQSNSASRIYPDSGFVTLQRP